MIKKIRRFEKYTNQNTINHFLRYLNPDLENIDDISSGDF